MARDEPMVNIRMPAGLKRALEEAAVREQRTLTKEMIVRLERSLLADAGAQGVREIGGDYLTADDAIARLPPELREPVLRLLLAAGTGMPMAPEVDDLRSNHPCGCARARKKQVNTR